MATNRESTHNIGETERWASVIGGGAIAAYGIAAAIAKRSWMHAGLAALGGALIRRGATGHCDVKQAIQGLQGSRRVNLYRVFTVANKPPQAVYEFWRNLENLPPLLGNLESVKVLSDTRSHWTARGPAGRSVEWDAEIVNDRPGRVIEWRSLPGSDLDISGIVRFTRKRGRGTKVHLSLDYVTPGGAVGEALARVLKAVPEQRIDSGILELREAMDNA